MGPNPIALSEILAYLQLYGTEDREAFIDYILKMDAAFMSASHKKQERKEQAEKANQGRQSPRS